ncbi:serine/threonine protein kinase, partial [Tieghemiomyces parasiticus]
SPSAQHLNDSSVGVPLGPPHRHFIETSRVPDALGLHSPADSTASPHDWKRTPTMVDPQPALPHKASFNLNGTHRSDMSTSDRSTTSVAIEDSRPASDAILAPSLLARSPTVPGEPPLLAGRRKSLSSPHIKRPSEIGVQSPAEPAAPTPPKPTSRGTPRQPATVHRIISEERKAALQMAQARSNSPSPKARGGRHSPEPAATGNPIAKAAHHLFRDASTSSKHQHPISHIFVPLKRFLRNKHPQPADAGALTPSSQEPHHRHHHHHHKRSQSEVKPPSPAPAPVPVKTTAVTPADRDAAAAEAGYSSSGSSENSAVRRRYHNHDASLAEYGQTIKVIGQGTGGTVRLLEDKTAGLDLAQGPNIPSRSLSFAGRKVTNLPPATDPMVLDRAGTAPCCQPKQYAVKEFRPRDPREPEREYYKKITSEYCIGSSIHHENIVETLDIVFEEGHVYEIMEYCPYDLFNVVATGKMTLDESACCFAQIVRGVQYLHSLGIAHRDLKLENCLLTEDGVLKVIDFGCAVVFKTPFESEAHDVTGFTGSDPYIAPELHYRRPYDPRASDIWSLGIVLFSMVLSKFPWKVARPDNSDYALYANNHNRRTCKTISSFPIKDAQPLLAAMLHPDIAKRATMDDVFADPWFKSIGYCRPGQPGANHTHHFC